MDKKQLLEFEKNVHLSITELRKAQPAIAAALEERLEKRLQRTGVTQLAGGSEKLRKVAETIKIPLGATPGKTKLREAVLKALREAAARDRKLASDEELKKELDELEKAATQPAAPGSEPDVTLADSLRLDEPIAFNPEFRQDLDTARLYRLSDAAGLNDKTAKALIAHVGSATEITSDRLAALVKGKKLTNTEAKAAGSACSLYHILDERPELVAAVTSSISNVREVAKNDSTAWLKIIRDSKTKPPGGISADEYAELLAKKTARLFPTDALAHRLAQVKVIDVLKEHARLTELRKLNPNVSMVGARNFSSLKVDGIASAELKKLKERYESTVRLTNRYAGMRLASVLDDGSLSDADKDREVIRRTDIANRFFADNTEVLGADLTPGNEEVKALKFAAGASDSDKAMILANARAYQRMMTVAEDPADAETLVVGGFHSALSIATSRADTIATRTGLKTDVLIRYREKAKEIASGVTAHIGTVIDIIRGGFDGTAVGNMSPALASCLKEIPGFADFFGNQDYCNCKHCQSILSPAAYFVDLMCFVEENITQNFFATKPTHPLNLNTRRPDLWTLEVTCENTNKSIPYLAIINEILENAVAKDVGFAGDFGDRAAVGTKVYKDILPGRVDSFKQPLNLPFEELRTYLRHFERNLADVAEAGNATGDTLARLRLALPPTDYILITQANDNLPFLRRVYGIQFDMAGDTVRKFNAQKLLKPMAVSRDELGELISSRFVTADGTVNIRIKGEKQSVDSIQNDIENIEGLTGAALDRMHRFVRLCRATGWRIGELDLVLNHVKRAGIGSGIDNAAVKAVAHIHRLQSEYDVSVEELTALWSLLPQHPIIRSAPGTSDSQSNGPTAYPKNASSLARFTIPLFTRLFNQSGFPELDLAAPPDFLHPALATAPPATVDPNLHRLLAGLGANDDELYQLIVGLAKPLGIDPSSGNDNKKKFALNLRNLSLLYRHARLARLLKVSIPELFALGGLTPEIRMTHVEDLIDLDALLKLHAWWKKTKWTLAELVEIVHPGLPAIVISAVFVNGTAGGETVTYTATIHGTVQPPETIRFGANANLMAAIANWNGRAQHTEAYRSDRFGRENPVAFYLAIRTKADTGPGSKIEITADTASIFATTLPHTAVGGAVVPQLPRQEAMRPEDLAKELVEQVRQSNTLVFADTVFSLLPPTAPVATSKVPLANTAGGELVTYESILNGRSTGAETITFAMNPTLDAAVTDWNAKASFTQAFRSDAGGNESASGNHFSVTTKGAAGSSTRLTLTADSAAIFAAVLPKECRGTEITETQSRAIVAANSASLETVDAEGHYRLKDGFNPQTALTLPAGVDSAMAPALQNVLKNYHGRAILLALLPSRIGVSPELTSQLTLMLGIDLDSNDCFHELCRAVPPAAIAGLIPRLQRLAILFEQESVFGNKNMEYIRAHTSLFGIDNFDRIGTTSVRRIELFRRFIDSWLAREEEAPDLRTILLAFEPIARYRLANQEELATMLNCDVGLLQSLHSQLSLSTTPFEALQELMGAVALAQSIGIGGTVLKLAQSSSYDDLEKASAAVQTAFRVNYKDEAEWEKKVEPSRDALLSRRRDGLIAYLVHSGAPQFDEVSDLYNYFLLDIEVEGCMRTSRVAAAIDSVQLYVHRCLMNLEETPSGDADPVHVLPDRIPENEWAWRKNYRIWEANRKIFLYPENYIEPELRDDKTPLFKTLEEELLSKDITDEAILDAYGRFLRGFDELAHLTIAGSYHEKDEKTRHDVLHLFGVTAGDPPVFYYRRVENAHYGVNSDDRATHWGAWEKLNIQVPVRKVAPIVHNGQLYIFWNRFTTKPTNKVESGTSAFVGYRHRGYVEFSVRRVDGSWTSPQSIRLETNPFNSSIFPRWYEKDGIINDPIVVKSNRVVGFLIKGTIAGAFDFNIRTDASGHGTVDFLGVSFEIQVPTTLLTSGGQFTIAGIDFVATPILEPALYAPLYDNKVHPEPNDGYTLDSFGWDQIYPSSGSTLSLRGFNFQMWSPVDLYKLKIGARYEYEDPEVTGVPWMNPQFIEVLALLLWLFSGFKFNLLDSFPRRYIWSRASGDRRALHISSYGTPCFDVYSFASVLLDEARIKKYRNSMAASPAIWARPQWSENVTAHFESLMRERQIASISGDVGLAVVNGSAQDIVIQTSRDAFYLQDSVRSDGKYHLRRLNTSISEDIADILFNKGLEQLLLTETQLGLTEHETDLNLTAAEAHDATKTGDIDFQGAMGVYLREIFFHAPFLIANLLNSQGRYEDAQRWYHCIFDPTATETIRNIPAGLSDEERHRRELDRNWRYREFRGLTLDTLRAQLTNESAIEQYKLDPFNPHAIARLRLCAYQKAIVMKYVDNLLDWGDDLFVKAFAQQNPEYLREATLKYIYAQEILGDRPAQLGDCGEGKLTPKTFPKIKDALQDGSEFLMEMESIIAFRFRLQIKEMSADKLVAIDAHRGAWATKATYARLKASDAELAAAAAIEPTRDNIHALVAAAPAAIKESMTHLTIADAMLFGRAKSSKTLTEANPFSRFRTMQKKWIPEWHWSFVREVSPIFCVPGNERMLSSWNRVEDRLFKLRHCQDIDGVFRLLPLFAPEIEPGLLVGGKAAGLSLEDILAASAGNLPPYRFRYLIDKAKGFASIAQSFGAALLSAIEKRDAEELARLRNAHQKNILALTTDARRNELKIAEESVEIVARRQAAAQYRKDYYDGLISSGLTPAEITETVARITATVASATRLGLATAAGVAHLLPQVGSPFAMKYGGKETGDSLKSFATVAGIVGNVSEMVATISGIIAGFERREQGWDHQKKLAAHDLKTIEKELAVAKLRAAIANRSLELHEKAKEQHDEVMEFFGDKFSNLGLYTYLSRSLQQLHREAYNNALAMSRLAEQAYRFERPGDTKIFVGGEWDASRSGLLAGERLLMTLHNMERRFIETNMRQSEINQSFSLAQIDPQALINLKESGCCEFAIPEFCFDMFYPGQYRRRVRAIRLTIPCITGPYTNISAKLTLLRSLIRKEATLGAAHLFEVPTTRTSSVAMSTGQGDAGVFELSFRDEKYMPFEGAGAVSEWRLELPSYFRPFDYQSINDVILNISYTAEENGVMRQQVESRNAALEGSLLHYLSNNTLTRVLSLRQEFSKAFNRIMESAADTPVTIDITDRHFPLFLQGRALTAAGATMVLAVGDRSPVGTVSISVNGTAATGFSNPTNPPVQSDVFGGLPAKALGGAFAAGLKRQHTIVVNNAGNLAEAAGTGPLFAPDKLRDILLVIEYRL